MDSQPGPSRIKDDSPERPQKKYKTENVDFALAESKGYKGSKTIDDLPDEIVVHILSYLSVPDRILNAQKVCDRWNFLLLSSEVFWKFVNLTDISNSLLIKILASLPACISHLRFVGRTESLPISLPELMAKLLDRCPFLESFYLENIHLVKNLHLRPLRSKRICESFNRRLVGDANSTLDEHSIQIIESEFRKEEDVGLKYVVLPHLKVLSLRRVLLNKFHIPSYITSFALPKLIVLDLSYSQPVTLEEFDLFSSLAELEELYLVSWEINDISVANFIRNSNKLRVLDLEHCRVTKKTISALERYCNCLEELYLSFCPIEDFSRTLDNQDFFPCLKKLCLIHTDVTPKGIERLVSECPSLKLVDVSNCVNIGDIWHSQLPKNLKEKIYMNPNWEFNCDHFLKSKYCKI